MQGGSFRLPNGNTLITDCDSAHILEVTETGEIVWEYTDTGSSNTVIARAQKYALDYFGDNDVIEGDLNGDGILNILDLVSLVNLILSNDYTDIGDLNEDGLLNVLDIVLIVNLILDS